MTVLSASEPSPEFLDPPLNGDLHLSPAQIQRYMEFHAARNAHHRALSLAAQIPTLPALATHPAPVQPLCSPSRHDVNTFFRSAAHLLAPRFSGRDTTILDLGCGAGITAPLLAEAGIRGTYIGLDIARHRKWNDAPIAGPAGRVAKRLIIADIARFDASTLPPLHLIVSSTSLEHIEDEHAAIRKLETRLDPGGCQAHFVPAEEALDLYGPHGWRQFSPICLQRLFPGGVIYRYGGPASNRLHKRMITDRLDAGLRDVRQAHPRLYSRALVHAIAHDHRLGNPGPAMYGVIVTPAPAASTPTHAGKPMHQYRTDLQYTNRLTKASYIAGKYAAILRGSVLDVGCDQAPLRALVADPKRYTGVDLFPPPQSGADVALDLDREDLPFAPRSFDTVICTDVLEHLERCHGVFDQLCAVSASRVIVSLPNPARNFAQALGLGTGGTLKYYGLPVDAPADRHRWFFGADEARRFFTVRGDRAGFDVEQMDAEEAETPIPSVQPWPDQRGRDVIRHSNLMSGTIWCVLKRRG